MKTIILIISTLLIFNISFAQKGKGNHGGRHIQHINDGPKHNHNSSRAVVFYNQPVKIKRNGPPSWAPAHGYRHRYIFFPEHNCYYDNYNGIYIYRKGSIWITSYTLPQFIFNIGVTRKVELNIDAVPKPQIYFEQHIALYD